MIVIFDKAVSIPKPLRFKVYDAGHWKSVNVDRIYNSEWMRKDGKVQIVYSCGSKSRSNRVIPMLDSVKEAFLEEKRNQEKEGLYCRSIIDGYQDFVFCNRFGEVLNLGVINKALRRIMRDCNEEILENYEGDDMPVLLPRFSCHTFRHTFTTRMCESGMNVKVIQGMLGHSDIRTTLDIYADITKELQDMAMDDLTRYLEEKKIS